MARAPSHLAAAAAAGANIAAHDDLIVHARADIALLQHAATRRAPYGSVRAMRHTRRSRPRVLRSSSSSTTTLRAFSDSSYWLHLMGLMLVIIIIIAALPAATILTRRPIPP